MFDGLIPGFLSYLGQRETNAMNRDLAQSQMDFQERMSSTAYQRATKDMQEAGLNPMLAYQNGGASTPAGALAQMSNALGAGVHSAQTGQRISLETQMNRAAVAKVEQETKTNQAQEKNIQADTLLKGLLAITEAARPENVTAQTGLYASQTGLANQHVQQSLAQQGLLNAQTLTELLRPLLITAQTGLASAQATTQHAQTENLNAITKRIDSEIQLINEQIKTEPTKRTLNLSTAQMYAQIKLLREVETQIQHHNVPQAKAGGEFYSGAIGEQSPLISFILKSIAGVKGAFK